MALMLPMRAKISLAFGILLRWNLGLQAVDDATQSPVVEKCVAFAAALAKSSTHFAMARLAELCDRLPTDMPNQQELYVEDLTCCPDAAPMMDAPVTLVAPGVAILTSIPIDWCLNGRMVAALLLLLIHLNESPVIYFRAAKRGHQPIRCGDGSDTVEALIATRTSMPVLIPWLNEGLPDAIDQLQCPVSMKPSAAFDKHMSDKGSFGTRFSRLYDLWLPPRRCSVSSVLEVGIGSMDKNVPLNMNFDSNIYRHDANKLSQWRYSVGASLRSWLEIFPFAEVVGLDVDRGSLVLGPRLSSYVCNTLNATRVREVLHGQVFDLIVDDGSHTTLGQRATMRALWPHLRLGGLYVIEDVSVEDVAHFLADLSHAVAVNTGAKTLMILSIRVDAGTNEPLPQMHVPNAQARYDDCWDSFLPGEVDRCCGRDGEFPQACISSLTRLAECCELYFVVSGVLA